MGLIIIIIITVILGIAGILALYDDRNKIGILCCAICVSLLFSLFGIFKAMITAPAVLDNAYKTEYIYTVQDNKPYYTTISTGKYLYYQYYYADELGGYSYNTIPAEDTIIYNDDVARVEYYTAQRKWFIFTVENVVYKLYVPSE